MIEKLVKTYCEKCHLYHAPNQTECYRCEECGSSVKQDTTDNHDRDETHPDYEGVTYPLFKCTNPTCGKMHFWD